MQGGIWWVVNLSMLLCITQGFHFTSAQAAVSWTHETLCESSLNPGPFFFLPPVKVDEVFPQSGFQAARSSLLSLLPGSGLSRISALDFVDDHSLGPMCLCQSASASLKHLVYTWTCHCWLKTSFKFQKRCLLCTVSLTKFNCQLSVAAGYHPLLLLNNQQQ